MIFKRIPEGFSHDVVFIPIMLAADGYPKDEVRLKVRLVQFWF